MKLRGGHLALFIVGFFVVFFGFEAKAAAPIEMHLKLDELTGATTSTDATSNGHDGAISGTVAIQQSGYDGYSYYYDGGDGRVTVSDYDYGSDGNYAIKIHWKITDDNVGTSYRYLFSTGNWTSNHTLMMFIGEDSLTADSNSLQNVLGFRLADSNDTVGGTYDNIIRVDVSSEVLDDAWHEVWFVATSGEGAKIYIDGIEKTTTTRMSDAFNPGEAGSAGYESDMNIGWRPRTTTNRYNKGFIDDVKVYDFAHDPYGSDELEIDSWADKKIIQRVGTTADFAISGSYSSSTPPTAIEYRLIDPTTTTTISGFDWATLDAAPADNY
jgi:hypothetical protein